MTGKTCALAGCSKPCVCAEHLACGELHHLLLMAGRYDPSSPHPYQLILDRNSSRLCALSSCSNAPRPGHPWCSKTHYLSWLSSFYASLSPVQICKLFPECTRHVFVADTDDTPPSQFCGWRHCQKFAMLNGLQQQHHYRPPSTQRESGHVPSVKYFMHAFKHFALNGAAPTGIRVDTEFFTKHPWEILAEGDTYYLIAQCKFTWGRKKKQRDMVTKDNYHWKQQGPPKEKNGYCRRYFSYRKLKAKKEGAIQYHDESSYTMKEYIMDDADLYSLVKVRKGSKKVCKRGKGRSWQEDDIVWFQESVNSNLDFLNCQFVEPAEEPFCVDDFFMDMPYSPVL